jgi:uncharacterized protein
VDPKKLIEKYYALWPEARDLLLAHSEAVAGKAVEIARTLPHLGADVRFVEEAAILHDIGILKTDAQLLGCNGTYPYIAHGHLGRLILDDEGLPRHAMVCERHVGVGLTADDIAKNGWPLPVVDMLPISIEEKIVSFADKFFSKNRDPFTERSLGEVRASVARWGEDKRAAFDSWAEMFSMNVAVK